MSKQQKEKDRPFKKDDKVIYQYTHWYNSRSCADIAKDATYIRKVKVGINSKHIHNWADPKVVIQVKGNKATSTVRLSEIRHEA